MPSFTTRLIAPGAFGTTSNISRRKAYQPGARAKLTAPRPTCTGPSPGAHVCEHDSFSPPRQMRLWHRAVSARSADARDDSVTIFPASQGAIGLFASENRPAALLFRRPRSPSSARFPLRRATPPSLTSASRRLCGAVDHRAAAGQIALTMEDQSPFTKHQHASHQDPGPRTRMAHHRGAKCQVYFERRAPIRCGSRATHKSGFRLCGSLRHLPRLDRFPTLYTNMTQAGALRGFGLRSPGVSPTEAIPT